MKGCKDKKGCEDPLKQHQGILEKKDEGMLEEDQGHSEKGISFIEKVDQVTRQGEMEKIKG